MNAAYLAEIFQPLTSVPPHVIIGLDVDGPVGAVQEAAGLRAREHLKEGEAIDVMPIGNDPVSTYMTSQTTAFYIKRTA